jgi:hypothetical protein
MDRGSVQAWLDRYSRAWETYEPSEIGDLFSEDAVYRYHPWDQGDAIDRGRDAIVRSWTAPAAGAASGRDAEGTYEGRYEAFAVDGDRAVGVGRSTYWTDAGRSTVRTVYHNVFLLEFNGDGRCRSFTEIFAEQPKGA